MFDCRVCGALLLPESMSQYDTTICKRCAAKLARRANSDAKEWYEIGLANGIRPWEHFPQEPRSAYMALTKQLESYPNQLSFKQLAEEVHYSEGVLKHWAQRWNWAERISEYYRQQDREKLSVQAETRKQMNLAQINIAQEFLDKALNRMHELDVSELTPKEVVALADLGSKLKRQAMDDLDRIAEAEIEERNNASQLQLKASEASATDKGLEEILNILHSSGALEAGDQGMIVDIEEGDFVDVESGTEA